MASIKGILSPNIENSLDEMNDNAVNNMPVPTPSVWDYAKTRASNSFMFGTSVALSTWAQQGDSPKYDEAQLKNLYPDTPDNYWKGGANAVQAEFLYDRFQKEQEAETQRKLIAGSSDPNPTGDTTLGVLGFGASVAGDVADPITPLSFLVGGAMTRVAGGLVGRAAPAFMEAISSSKYIRGGAALGGEIINNIGATLGAEVGVKYPLNKTVLNDFEKKNRTLYDTTVNSLGSAVVMGVLGHYGGKLFRSAFGKEGSAAPEFAERMRNESFYKTKDQTNALLGSPSAHEANFNEAAARTFTEAPSTVRTSNTEVMAGKAFNKAKTPEFQALAPFYGVYEKNSGKLDYAGERYGDTHVFMSSPEAAQGMLDNYATKNPYEIYGHKGGLNLLDLNNTPANDHVDVLDIIENELGATFFNKLPDNASLADVFKSVMDSEGHEGLSGNDIVGMFNKINKQLEGQGYQGTLHKELQGDTNHDVMSVFDSAMNEKDMAKVFEGTSSNPDTTVIEDPIIPRAQADIVTLDGKIIKAEEELPHDIFYDNDPEFKKEYDKFNDPEYLAKVQETMNSDPYDVKIEDTAKEVMADIKESLKQIAERYHGSSSELTNVADPEMYGSMSDNNIYGGGFYTTDNLDVGKKYMKKGKGNTPSLYKIEEKVPVKSFNLDEAMTAEIHSELSEIADAYDYSGEGHLYDIMQENSKLGRALDEMRKSSASVQMTKGTFQDMVIEMQSYLKTLGYGAFEHTGGLLTNSKTQHNVKIYWEPSTQLKIDPIVEHYNSIQEQVKEVQKEIKNNTPEKENEVVKAMENCLRKY